MIRQSLFGAAALLLALNWWFHSSPAARPASAAEPQPLPAAAAPMPIRSSVDSPTVTSLNAQLDETKAELQQLREAIKQRGSSPVSTARPAGSISSLSCAQMRESFGVIIGKDWGSLPAEGQQRWQELSCDQLSHAHAEQSISGAAAQPQAIAERGQSAAAVDVPDGDSLPAELRQLPRGTDLFISFASSSMAPFALNWVANLRKAGVKTQLVGTLDDKMLTICREQGIMVSPACMRPRSSRASPESRSCRGRVNKFTVIVSNVFRHFQLRLQI